MSKTSGQTSVTSLWSKEKHAKAEAKCNYIKIDKPGQLLLTGALKMWITHPNFIYVPSLRIAGESEVTNPDGSQSHPVFTFLTSVLNLPQAEAVNDMGGAYSLESVVGNAKAPYQLEEINGPLAGQFKAELEKCATVKKTVVKKVNTVTLADINKLGKQIKDSLIVTVPKKSLAPKAPKAQGTGGSHKKPLIGRVIALSADKVMDVSGLGVNKPAKPIAVPKSTNSSKYIVNLQLYDAESKQNISKGVVSNNPESLKIALEQIYPGETNTVNTYLTSWQNAKASASVAKTATGPTVSGVVSIVPAVQTVPAVTAPLFANGISSPASQKMESLFGK